MDPYSKPGEIYLSYGQSWPDIYPVRNAITIEYETGVTDGDSLPDDYRTWLYMRTGSLYENRESITNQGDPMELPRDFVDGMLDGLNYTDLGP